MFDITEGFNIVISNPPYVPTKGVGENDKHLLKKQYGFSDDLYNHFYFKGMQLLSENGILSYISSKTLHIKYNQINLN
jgi:methylase of polypeptide subunit release factors